jgi:hypothetical protein
MAAAAPLPRGTRHAYLQDVASELAKCEIIGDGTVARVCREVQRKHFDPPDLAQAHGTAKYR